MMMLWVIVIVVVDKNDTMIDLTNIDLNINKNEEEIEGNNIGERGERWGICVDVALLYLTCLLPLRCQLHECLICLFFIFIFIDINTEWYKKKIETERCYIDGNFIQFCSADIVEIAFQRWKNMHAAAVGAVNMLPTLMHT